MLSFDQSLYRQGVLIGILFLLVLGLNLLEKRFWCKYLCPLGAFLGRPFPAFPAQALRRAKDAPPAGPAPRSARGTPLPMRGTTGATRSASSAGTATTSARRTRSASDSARSAQAAAMDLGRRRVIASALSGIAAVPLLRARCPRQDPARRTRACSGRRGRCEEKEFLKRCVKCGECMKVCTTNGLQPALFEAGRGGHLVPAAGAPHRLLRVPLHALRSGLPHGRHPAADAGAEGEGPDRHGHDRQGQVPALGPWTALHRLRRGLPDPEEGDLARGSARCATGRGGR